ncbi:MAG: hypothetical protein ABJN40_01625 [Sneathiella sp.]
MSVNPLSRDVKKPVVKYIRLYEPDNRNAQGSEGTLNLTGAFNAITEIANEKRKAQDLEDLNHERSGVESGRMQRFLVGGNGSIAQQAKKDREDAQLRTMLDVLMQDQEYAALWNEVDQDTLKAQSKVDALQERIDTAIEQAKEGLQQTLNDAVTLPDGRKAFMGEDGVVRAADGQKVDPAIVSGIDWTGRPTYDDYRKQRDTLDKLNDLDRQNRANSAKLGDIRNRLHDDENPSSKDDLKRDKDTVRDIEKDIDGLNVQVDAALSKDQPQQTTEMSIAPPALDKVSVLPEI